MPQGLSPHAEPYIPLAMRDLRSSGNARAKLADPATLEFRADFYTLTGAESRGDEPVPHQTHSLFDLPDHALERIGEHLTHSTGRTKRKAVVRRILSFACSSKCLFSLPHIASLRLEAIGSRMVSEDWKSATPVYRIAPEQFQRIRDRIMALPYARGSALTALIDRSHLLRGADGPQAHHEMLPLIAELPPDEASRCLTSAIRQSRHVLDEEDALQFISHFSKHLYSYTRGTSDHSRKNLSGENLALTPQVSHDEAGDFRNEFGCEKLVLDPKLCDDAVIELARHIRLLRSAERTTPFFDLIETASHLPVEQQPRVVGALASAWRSMPTSAEPGALSVAAQSLALLRDRLILPNPAESRVTSLVALTKQIKYFRVTEQAPFVRSMIATTEMLEPPHRSVLLKTIANVVGRLATSDIGSATEKYFEATFRHAPESDYAMLIGQLVEVVTGALASTQSASLLRFFGPAMRIQPSSTRVPAYEALGKVLPHIDHTLSDDLFTRLVAELRGHPDTAELGTLFGTLVDHASNQSAALYTSGMLALTGAARLLPPLQQAPAFRRIVQGLNTAFPDELESVLPGVFRGALGLEKHQALEIIRSMSLAIAQVGHGIADEDWSKLAKLAATLPTRESFLLVDRLLGAALRADPSQNFDHFARLIELVRQQPIERRAECVRPLQRSVARYASEYWPHALAQLESVCRPLKLKEQRIGYGLLARGITGVEIDKRLVYFRFLAKHFSACADRSVALGTLRTQLVHIAPRERMTASSYLPGLARDSAEKRENFDLDA